MPPSGFNSHHTTILRDFLRSCFRELQMEMREGENLHNALRREISSIERDLKENKREPAATAVLNLVHAFYTRALTKAVPNGHLVVGSKDAEEYALGAIATEILGIHIREVPEENALEKEEIKRLAAYGKNYLAADEGPM